MDEGGKQLGALVIAIVVILALIVIAKAVIPALKDKMEDELDKVDSGYVQMVDMPTYEA